MKDNFKVIFVIIGAFIGAGFASGREIYTFFYVFGKKGLLGIVISSILFSLVVYRTLIIVKNNPINNYKELVSNRVKFKNEFLKNSINYVINILILVTFFVMVAGFGAYFEQEFKINSWIGSSILAVLSYFIIKKDTKGLIKINQALVPSIIIFIIVIGIIYIGKEPANINIVSTKNESNFFINSILYCSYNCIMLIPVLITVKKYVKNKNSITIISVIAGIIIFILSIILFYVLSLSNVDLKNVEIPIISILNNRFLKSVYGIIILSAITTTAISIGSGFVKNISTGKKSYSHIIKIMCITSVIVSQIGFSNLINILYPIFGYIGIVQIIKLFA